MNEQRVTKSVTLVRLWIDSKEREGRTLIRQAFWYSCICFESLKVLRGEE